MHKLNSLFSQCVVCNTCVRKKSVCINQSFTTMICCVITCKITGKVLHNIKTLTFLVFMNRVQKTSCDYF